LLLVEAIVSKQEQIVPGHYRLYLFAPKIAEAAKPGQFLHIRCSNALDPLLRRPISIHAVDRAKSEVILFYRVAGRGTALLSKNKAGDRLSILGPLGQGFSIPGARTKVAVVSGGIGIAPLYFLLQEMAGSGICADVFLGAVTAKQLFFSEEIMNFGHRVIPSTDDGSAGYHGTVTALFEEHIQKDNEQSNLPMYNKDSLIYGCGPHGMLKRLTEIINKSGISGEISLEERMGCGVGACLSCVCKIRDKEGGVQYRRACVEGPVFAAGEVIWD